MKWRAWLSPWNPTFYGPTENPDLTGLTADSRTVKPGDVFIALKGHATDGHAHAVEAVQAGARAVVAEKPLTLSVPVAVVGDTAKILGPLAAGFYGHPSRSLAIAGVTGTNGKTTVTYFLESIFKAAGISGGVLGTVGYRWAGHSEVAPNTTPHGAEVQRLLADMAKARVTHVAMEVSSHALALGRVEDVSFGAAVFTNLSQDHLDFHKTLEDYFKAKSRLFTLLDQAATPPGVEGKIAVVNGDDPFGRRLAETLSGRLWTFSLAGGADVFPLGLSQRTDGSDFRLVSPAGDARVSLRLAGSYNVQNALAAAAVALGWGLPLFDVVHGLEALEGVPGRLERVVGRNVSPPVSVYVDFAHTPKAVQNILQVVRPLTRGRLILVFGCGGDRDRTKRPLMGEVAAQGADHVIVTSDNPRSEDPAAIASEVEAGVRRANFSAYELILDRRVAIDCALGLARPGDVVVLAGKGHETEQIYADRREPHDDRALARTALDRLFP